MNAAARERLLDAAGRLFSVQGVAATGINAITAEAGVAKMSLYNSFSSKQALVAAHVRSRHEALLRSYEARVETAQDPAGRVMAMFDAYLEHARADHANGFRGCGLLNIAGELPLGDPVRAMIAAHKAEIEQRLRAELEAAGADYAERTARHLSLLLEGAMSRAGLEGTSTMIQQARELAVQLLALDPRLHASRRACPGSTTAGEVSS